MNNEKTQIDNTVSMLKITQSNIKTQLVKHRTKTTEFAAQQFVCKKQTNQDVNVYLK